MSTRGRAADMSTEELFLAIRAECDRLDIDESMVSVDAPHRYGSKEGWKEKWWCGLNDAEKDVVEGIEYGFTADTLDEALGGILQCLRSTKEMVR